MLQNLLTALPEGGKMISIPESLLYALIGFIVVFAGITLLIAVVWAVGKVMSINTAKNTANSAKPKVERQVQAVQPAPVVSDDIDEETVAVITAALMAYYQTNKPQCGFTVKRIKRI